MVNYLQYSNRLFGKFALRALTSAAQTFSSCRLDSCFAGASRYRGDDLACKQANHLLYILMLQIVVFIRYISGATSLTTPPANL